MKKRILHLLASNSYSGAENIVIDIIFNLGNKYEMAYASSYGDIANVLNQKKIKYIPLENFSVLDIKKVIEIWKPDIIHAHDFRASIMSSALFHSKKIISHLHNNPMWLSKLNILTVSYLIASLRIDKILCVSPAVLEEYVFSKIIKNKTIILPNAIDCKKVLQLAKRETWNNNYDIAFVGRLSEQKNPLRFIRIIKELSKRIPTIKAVMLGDGVLANDCREKILDMGLEKNITMLGFKENPFPILNNAKLLIVTSKWEGYGLVAVEALALGKPVLSTPVGGLKNIVNNLCGHLCKLDEDFVNEAERLLTNESYYKNLSDNATKRAQDLGNVEVYMQNLSYIYDSVI